MFNLFRRFRANQDPSASGELCIAVEADCTRRGALARLLDQGKTALEGPHAALVIDLRALRKMNSQLLSSVIWLARECARRGIAFGLANVPSHFQAWATSHRLMEVLPAIGVHVRHDR